MSFWTNALFVCMFFNRIYQMNSLLNPSQFLDFNYLISVSKKWIWMRCQLLFLITLLNFIALDSLSIPFRIVLLILFLELFHYLLKSHLLNYSFMSKERLNYQCGFCRRAKTLYSDFFFTSSCPWQHMWLFSFS